MGTIGVLVVCLGATIYQHWQRQGKERVVIGLVGKAGHGKDSIGDVLEQQYGFNRYAMAKPLKDAIEILFGFTENQLYGSKKEVVDPRWGVSPRRVLQFFGTEICRNMFPKLMPTIKDRFWINHLLHHVAQLHEEYEDNYSLVVTDIRFINEAEVIQELNGILIKVIRPNYHQFSSAKVPEVPEVTSTTKIAPVAEKMSLVDIKKQIDDLTLTSRPLSPEKEAYLSKLEALVKELDEKEKNHIKEKDEEKSNGSHESERQLEAITPDIVIINDGTLKDLAQKIADAHAQIPNILARKRAKLAKKSRKDQ
jgi:hypothetical protein